MHTHFSTELYNYAFDVIKINGRNVQIIVCASLVNELKSKYLYFGEHWRCVSAKQNHTIY